MAMENDLQVVAETFKLNFLLNLGVKKLKNRFASLIPSYNVRLIFASILFVIAVCLPPKRQGNEKWTPVKPSYRIGETVWLNCATGYKLAESGVSSVTCGKDTQWSTPSPTCQGKKKRFSILFLNFLCMGY